MTDRKLLELASKAAGFHFHGHRVGLGYANCYVSRTGDTDDWFVWSPLADDGAALRLAVTLRLDVNAGDGNSAASWWVNGKHLGNSVTEPHDADPYAATRRAIVRAAAEIGKAMP